MDSQPNISRFAACMQVFRLTLRRQFFSRQTIVIFVLLLLALAISVVWAVPKPWSPDRRGTHSSALCWLQGRGMRRMQA